MNRVRAVLAALLLSAWSLIPGAGTVRATDPLVSMTLKVSPSIVWYGTVVRFTGVVTPVSGTPTNLGLTMGTYFGENGTCEPAAICSVNTTSNHNANWLIPSLTAPLTVTYDVVAPAPNVVTTLSVTTDGVGCTGACPPSVAVKRPTVTSKVTYSPSGIVMPGDTLHFVVGATTNVPSPDRNYPECVTLSSGLGIPTNVQATIPVPSWNPYLGSVCGNVGPFATTRTLWVAFDSVVTGPLGSDVTVHGANLDGLGEYVLVNQTLKIHIGPLPTATPKPAPNPTPARTGLATAHPSAVAPAPTLSSSVEPEPTLESAAPTVNASPIESLPPDAASAGPPSSPSPVTAPASNDSTGMAPIALLALAALVVALAFGAIRFRGSRRRRPVQTAE